MVTFSSKPGIAKVKWLADSRRLVFLGQRDRDIAQIWMVDSQTNELVKITNHDTRLKDFDITPDGSTCIYAAEQQRVPPSAEYLESGFVFDWLNQFLEDVLRGEYSPLPGRYYSDLYIGRVGGKVEQKLNQTPLYVTSLSIAPDGENATAFLLIKDPPEEWDSYKERDISRLVAAARDKRNRSTDTNLNQYFLIDVSTLSFRPLLNAHAFGGSIPPFWTDDGREVILCETYLPLSLPNAASTEWNDVVSVTLEDMKPHLIRSEPKWLLPEQWKPRSNRLVLQRLGTSEYSVYESISHEWRLSGHDVEGEVRVAVKESMNLPPELEAQEWSGNNIMRRNVISGLHPELSSLNLSEAKVFEWMSKDNLPWRAIIYMPPGYDERQRYPLVIQTHGYNEKEFEVDGRSTTAMASQALANSGIIVVQSWGPTVWASRSLTQATQWMNGIESLIDVLTKQATIDPKKVGLAGWSYTGWLVEYFISHSEYPIGAAVAADNVEYTYWEYLALSNSPATISEGVLMYGGSPWEKPDVWRRESTEFNLDHVYTPLRIETESDSPLYAWDIYAGLKALHKPAELVIIPNSPRARDYSEQPARIGAALAQIDFSRWFGRLVSLLAQR